MSQAGPLSGGSSPPPPGGEVTFVTDANSPAVTISRVLNIPGGQVVTNNDKGLQTDGSSGSNTLTIQLTNRKTGTVTTTDATLTTIITFALSASAGTAYVYGNAQAFNASTPSSGAYSYSAGYRTDGATATELGTEFHDEFEDPVLETSDIFLNVSGNNVLVQVRGVAGLTINWNAILEFRQVS